MLFYTVLYTYLLFLVIIINLYDNFFLFRVVFSVIISIYKSINLRGVINKKKNMKTIVREGENIEFFFIYYIHYIFINKQYLC